MNIIRINMKKKTIENEKVEEKSNLLGGRALIAKMAYEEIPPLCHPLGPNNKLIITTTPLAGYGISSVGRTSIGGKSPLTGGIKESNSGGNAGDALAKHGIRALVFEDLPEEEQLYILKISGKHGRETSELISAESFRGKGTYQTCKELLEQYGKQSAIIVIGQAGERFLSSAGVFISDSDGYPTRACGRGGMGAVMGKKGIKAIVIQNDATHELYYYNKEAFQKQRDLFHKNVLQHPSTKGYTEYGTLAAMLPLDTMGGVPALNFRKGSWERVAKLSAETLRDTIIKRNGEGAVSHSCMTGCIIRCSNKFADENGKIIVSPLEYENVALLGPNIGIDDLNAIGKLNYMCNDVGVDTMETGVALGVLADIGYFEFGDVEVALDLMREIKKGSPIGRIIASGASVAGKVFGHHRVPIVRNQGIPAHEPRNIKGMSATYVTSPMGADHTAAVTFRAQMDHKCWKGAIDISREIQVTQAFYDSHCCTFLSRSFSEDVSLFLNLLNYVYGCKKTESYIKKFGKEVLKYEYSFNKAAQLTETMIPEFMRYEGIGPDNTVSDIPQSEYERFWEEEYFGEFPEPRTW